MTAAEAFRAIGRECLRHLAANVPGTILGTVESLHQLRVGLRRLRAAMSLFADILDEDQANRMKRELQWVNRCVGPARDVDVLLGTGSAAAIRTRLTAQRRRAYAAAARALRSRRFNNLVLDLANWIESAHKMHAKRPVVVHATAELTRRHKKLVRQLADLPVLDPAQRHDLRIRAKRLRYGIEFFGPVFGRGKNARRRHHLLSALKHLQDKLGILNDIATQRQLIGRFSPAAAATPVAEADAPQHLDAAIAAARKVAKAKPFWT
jgi:CHAD domain-containing protein